MLDIKTTPSQHPDNHNSAIAFSAIDNAAHAACILHSLYRNIEYLFGEQAPVTQQIDLAIQRLIPASQCRKQFNDHKQLLRWIQLQHNI